MLKKEAEALVMKLMEIEETKKEHEMVLESISKLEDTRKCWRLINGVLVEKTKLDVVPAMRVEINNFNAVGKQIQDSLVAVRQEIKNLESAHEYIMKQAAAQKSADPNAAVPQQKESVQGGVLV